MTFRQLKKQARQIVHRVRGRAGHLYRRARHTKHIVPAVGIGALIILFGITAVGLMAARGSKTTEEQTVPIAQQVQESVEESPVGQPIQPPPCELKDAYYATVRPPKSAVMYSAHSEDSTEIVKISYGTKVTAGCLDGAWLKTFYKDQLGYVLAEQLNKKKPAPLSASTPQPSNPVIIPPNDDDTDPPDDGPDDPDESGTANVEQITLSVSPVTSSLLPLIGCQQNFTFTARVTTTGTGKVKYRWQRSNGVTELGSFNITAGATQYVLTHVWTVNQTSAGSVQFFATSPNQVSSNSIGFNFLRGLCF